MKNDDDFLWQWLREESDSDEEFDSMKAQFGTDQVKLKIAGGKPVIPHSVPWHALIYIIYDGGEKVCGGALIEQNWILTGTGFSKTLISL